MTQLFNIGDAVIATDDKLTYKGQLAFVKDVLNWGDVIVYTVFVRGKASEISFAVKQEHLVPARS